MKNIILSVAVLSFVLVSCNQKNKQDETTNSATNKPETTTAKVNQSFLSIKEIVATICL